MRPRPMPRAGPAGGTPFGDGLLCVDGAIVRLGTKVAMGGSSRYPEAGDATISVRGLVAADGNQADGDASRARPLNTAAITRLMPMVVAIRSIAPTMDIQL